MCTTVFKTTSNGTPEPSELDVSEVWMTFLTQHLFSPTLVGIFFRIHLDRQNYSRASHLSTAIATPPPRLYHQASADMQLHRWATLVVEFSQTIRNFFQVHEKLRETAAHGTQHMMLRYHIFWRENNEHYSVPAERWNQLLSYAKLLLDVNSNLSGTIRHIAQLFATESWDYS